MEFEIDHTIRFQGRLIHHFRYQSDAHAKLKSKLQEINLGYVHCYKNSSWNELTLFKEHNQIKIVQFTFSHNNVSVNLFNFCPNQKLLIVTLHF